MSAEQKRGVCVCLPKSRDATTPAEFRPRYRFEYGLQDIGPNHRVWRSTVSFVSPNISYPHSIESSTPGIPSTHGAFALFRTSLQPTALRYDSSLCSNATPVSYPHSIESSTPGIPSTHGAFALLRTSLQPTALRSDSSLCSNATTPVEFLWSSIIAFLSSAWCLSP